MTIRCAAKALLVRDGQILINRCVSSTTNEVYYDLPGGGQHPYETMEEAVIREVAEETGYTVRVVRFAAIAEEIHDSQALREQYPDYCHRIHHIFLVEPVDDTAALPSEMDFQQQESVWVSLSEANSLPFFPTQLCGRISELVQSLSPVYLGSEHIGVPFCF